MSIFTLGSPPLKVRVGTAGDGACYKLGSDPSGLSGRPYDTTQAMSSVTEFKPFSPNCVRWLVVTTYQQKPDGSLGSFEGLDAVGQWWHGNSYLSTGMLYRGSEPGTDDRSWFEKAVDDVAKAIVKYGIPIIAAALAATGVGGIVAAGALAAWRNLAMGQSLTESIVNAQKEDLAKSDISLLDAFNQGLAKARSGLSDQALQKSLALLPSAPTNPEVRKIFYEAVTLVRARQTQDLTVAQLSRSLINTTDSVWGDEALRMNLALKWGAPLSTVMNGLRGQAGDRQLLTTAQASSNFVAANVEDPKKIRAAIENPTLAFKDGVAVTASGGGGSSSSSGPGIGTALVVGGLGYGLYKFWPKIMHSFSRPGQPKRGFR